MMTITKIDLDDGAGRGDETVRRAEQEGDVQWVESAQYRLLPTKVQQALSCVDLLICACAAGRGLVVLHDDKDFVAAARHLPDLAERRVRSLAEIT